MARHNYREIERRIVALDPFEGHSMTGEWRNGAYVVWSYATPIAYVDPSHGAHVDLRPYSRTTARHQGLVRRMLAAVEPHLPEATTVKEEW